MIVGVQIILALALVGGVYREGSAVRLIAEHWPLRFVGIALLLVAPGIILKARADLGRSFRIHPRPHSEAIFVRHGIYAHLRHPMYTSVLLICVGVSILHPTPWVLSLAAVNAAFYLIKARYEESLLLDRYEDYREYRRRSWGVIPFLR